MARTNVGVFLPNKDKDLAGFTRYNPALDLSFGGQQGYTPVLAEWLNNQAYVRRQLIPILLEAPAFFSAMPNPSLWVATLKSLVELHPKTIEGFNAALTVEFDQHPVGGAGEMQDEVIDTKRARTEPVFGFVEKFGMPIQSFLYSWITYGMMDPDTKTALIGTLDNKNVIKGDLLANWYTMSMLFIEPDVTHKKVLKSWVTTNMAPKGTGEIIGKRDLTTAGEILNLSIEFTGISQFNLGTNVMAQSILDKLNANLGNPYLRKAFIEAPEADVDSANDVGYKAGIDDLKNNSVAAR